MAPAALDLALAVAAPAHHHEAVVAAPRGPSPMDLSTLLPILLLLILLLVFLPPPKLLLLLSTVLLLKLLLVLAALLDLLFVLVLLLLGLQPLPPHPSRAAPFSVGAASPRRGRSPDSTCCGWDEDLVPGGL